MQKNLPSFRVESTHFQCVNRNLGKIYIGTTIHVTVTIYFKTLNLKLHKNNLMYLHLHLEKLVPFCASNYNIVKHK